MTQNDIDVMGLASLPAVAVDKDIILLTNMEDSTPDGHAVQAANTEWKADLARGRKILARHLPADDTEGGAI